MAIRLVILGFIVAGMGFFACSDDDDIVAPKDEFAFELTVNTVEGEPVPGLRVSIWSLFEGLGIGKIEGKGAAEPQFATTLRFDLPLACSVSLAVYDMAGELVSTLADQPFTAGAHEAVWALSGGTEVLGDGVYQGVFRAANDAGEPLLQDTIFMVLSRRDPEMTVFGYTDAGGRYTTRDILRFPHLLALPALMQTSEAGEELGTFSYRSWVMVTLTDTTTGAHAEYLTEIFYERNQVDYTWTPGTALRVEVLREARDGETGTRCQESVTAGPLPTEFRLYQNYPNPFN